MSSSEKIHQYVSQRQYKIFKQQTKILLIKNFQLSKSFFLHHDKKIILILDVKRIFLLNPLLNNTLMSRRSDSQSQGMTRNYTVSQFMEDMIKIKLISKQNGLDFRDLVMSMIKFGEQNNVKVPGFQIFKRLAMQQDFLNKQDIYNYDSNGLQEKIKSAPLKFNIFYGIPEQQKLISAAILKTDFKTATEIFELNVAVKNLPQFMLKEYETEIRKRLHLQDVSVLNIEVYKKAEDLYRILVHIINKNIVKNQEKRQESREQTEKYLESLAKRTGEDVSKSLQYADVISNVSDPKIYSQEGGTCYAHAVAEALYSTQARIKGRTLQTHQKIAQRIIKKHGSDGGIVQVCLDQQCPPKRIRWQTIDAKRACEAVLMGRVVIAQFCLSKQGWDDYSNYRDQGKSMVNLQKMKKQKQEGSGGHAVAIVGVDTKQKAWIVKNAWGTYQKQSIKYRRSIVKIKMNIKHFEYLDVYFWESDLNVYEILSYQKFLKTKTKDQRQLEKRKEQLLRTTTSYFTEKLTQSEEVCTVSEDTPKRPSTATIPMYQTQMTILYKFFRFH